MPLTINLAVYGVGLVGSEFIKQVLRLRPIPNTRIRIVEISNSKKSVNIAEYGSNDAEPGIKEDWETRLSRSQTASNEKLLTDLPDRLKAFNNPPQSRLVLVDNTSSASVADAYPSLLKRGVSIVTPNKKAFSGSLDLWQQIVLTASEGGSSFLNEATVGAGLPVINTLKEMVGTGDEIVKIEGVFSGTMSYIFNNFSPANPPPGTTLPSFSEVVKVARENGYTEPNPADDLNGSDVARKLTILSRHIGCSTTGNSLALQYGFEDVQTSSLVPRELKDSEGEEFMRRLPDFDEKFGALRDETYQEGNVLRYVGVVDPVNGIVKASLEKYPSTHPFAASLKGSDNIILFYSERYADRPLIIQGAGAGAAVTAMGVLGDVLKFTL